MPDINIEKCVVVERTNGRHKLLTEESGLVGLTIAGVHYVGPACSPDFIWLVATRFRDPRAGAAWLSIAMPPMHEEEEERVAAVLNTNPASGTYDA